MTIDFYAWSTPNGRKVAVALEEMGFSYRVKPVDITKGEQHEPGYLKISPNNKIPAIVDHEPDDGEEPIAVFESAAIGYYLAEKVRSPLVGTDARSRALVMEWTMFQMASVGPMFGQAGHFYLHADDDVPYAKRRYREEMARLLGVMDRRLGEVPYLAGNGFTLADVMSYSWVDAARTMAGKMDGLDFGAFGRVEAWLDRCSEREGVRRGMAADLTKAS